MIGTIAIIGSGLAGVRATQALRTEGYDGRLFLIGEEPHHPYDRPSLSKEVLASAVGGPPDLVDQDWISGHAIDLVAGDAVTSIDGDSRRMHFASGTTLVADRILLATGARSRALAIAGSKLRGIHSLRSLDDARRLQAELRPGKRLVVVGGGLIGCEVASTACGTGVDVTIIEVASELMQRVMDPTTARWCRRALEREGVEILLNAGVTAFEGEHQVASVICSDGRHIAADLVLVSIGAEPSTELGAMAGLRCDRGILVDATGATDHPDIFAAGDAASWPLVGGGRRSFETYLNAQAQAAVAAQAILGKSVLAPQIPLSWTRLASHHVQMMGDMAGPGQVVLHGDPTTDAFLSFRIADERVVACVSANMPRDFAVARRLVDTQARVDLKRLGDAAASLRDLLKTNQGICA